jgi:hypothetical protein
MPGYNISWKANSGYKIDKAHLPSSLTHCATPLPQEYQDFLSKLKNPLNQGISTKIGLDKRIESYFGSALLSIHPSFMIPSSGSTPRKGEADSFLLQQQASLNISICDSLKIPAVGKKKKVSGIALISLILSILAFQYLFLFILAAIDTFISPVPGPIFSHWEKVSFYVISPVLGSLSIFFGIMALLRLRKHKERVIDKGYAIPAIVVGIVEILLTLFVVFTKQKL